MSLKHKKFKNEKGFAIALALLMLVVMSLMGATLMVVAAGDHKRNSNMILVNKHSMLQKRELAKRKNGWPVKQV